MKRALPAAVAITLALMPHISVAADTAAGALPAMPARAAPIYLGADLSFANEMEDCGARFLAKGKPADPFQLIKQHGGNLVRVRIWNNPEWTHYSTYDDVLKTVRRAHAAGLQVLLDFHYSDDWADGEKQIAPAAWANLPTAEQANALYAYTREILDKLAATGENPELVQVGNEINPELMGGTKDKPIDWSKDAMLINAGIKAVRDAGKASGHPARLMLHVAQPENILPWFDAATQAGVLDYDIIGISYYPKWSKFTMVGLGKVIETARARYHADVMVVETAYPFTLDHGDDNSTNVLGEDSLVPGYPATPSGQRKYMQDITRTTLQSGGDGVVYWAPDWVTTQCKTRWGTGSTWENATWFDIKHHEALPVFDFMSADYGK